VGGVAADHLAPGGWDVLSFDVEDLVTPAAITRLCEPQVYRDHGVPRPLLVGSSVLLSPDGRLVIVGGGAACHKGVHFTSGIYSLSLPVAYAGGFSNQLGSGDGDQQSWEYWRTTEVTPGDDDPHREPNSLPSPAPTVVPIRRMRLESRDQFLQVIEEGKPVVLEGLTLGSCVARWNAEYLTNTVGHGHRVGTQPGSSSWRASDHLTGYRW